MLSLKTLHPTLLAAAAIAVGCTGEVADGADADTSSTHPLLVVEQSAPVADSSAVRSHVSVWFLRLSDERDFASATSLVTPRLELPPVGSCVAVGVEDDHPVPAKISRVELAFAGDVRMKAGEISTPLTVRFFPNVADFVSGVTYTLQDQNDLGMPFDGWLTVNTTGSNELDPMEASTQAPAVPAGLKLHGVDLATAEVTVPRDQSLALAWIPGGLGDVIYVDVDPVPAVASERVRCAFADTGIGEIPTVAVPESPEMSLAIHRSRDVVLKSDRGDVGMAHFDLSVTARVRVAP